MNTPNPSCDCSPTGDEARAKILWIKDITIRFLSEDVPDSTEKNVRLAFSHIRKDLSVVEEVELQEAGHLTWASDRFVDLYLSGSEDLTCLASWPGGQTIAPFCWTKASLLTLLEEEQDTFVEQPAQAEDGISNTHKPILSFATYAGKDAPNQDAVAETLSGLLDPIEAADAQSLRHLPFSLPPIPLLLRAAGERFLRRWRATQSHPLVDNAIACFERVVRLTHPLDKREEYAAYLHKAIDVFISRRASSAHDRQDLPSTEWRIARMERFAKSFDNNNPHALPRLHFSFLGHLLYWKYLLTESLDDISNSVSAFERQVSLMAPGEAGYINAVKGLCFSLSIRHTHGSGNVEDVESSITLLHGLLQHISPNEPFVKADILTQLASQYQLRSISNMNSDDITLAINYQREALALTPPGQPKDVEQLAKLAAQLRRRSGLLDDVGDCNEAITIYETITQSNPPTSASQHFSELASSLVHRATLTNSLADLSRAIFVVQTTINATPPASPSYVPLLFTLAHVSSTRFSMTSSISDLQASIATLEKVIGLGTGYFTQAGCLYILGIRKRLLFTRQGGLSNLSSSIDALKASVDLTPKGDHRLPDRLHNLALAFAEQYEVTGAIDDINDAIAAHEQAIALTPTDSVHIASRIAWFASTLEGRYKKEKTETNLNAAISMFRKALDNLPQSSTELALEPFIKGGFAQLLANRFRAERNPEDVKTAFLLVEPMINDPTVRLQYRLSFASGCTIWSLWAEDEERALRYGAVTVDLLTESTSFEQTVHDRYSYLVRHYALGVVCAGVALHFGHLETGLEWLEQGRCLVWSQISQLQTPLDDLRTQRPDLADRLEQAGKLVRSSGTRTPSALLPDTLSLAANQVHQHTDAAQEWHQTLEEIRGIDEFRGFLKPPKAPDLLARLPQEGAVVTFSILKFGCFALALVAGRGIIRIPLDEFSATKASSLRDKLKAYLKETGVLTRSSESLRGMSWENEDLDSRVLSSVLADLWLYVVRPVIDTLELEPLSSDKPRPRIWWCPTGPLSFLPLHAAGLYGSDYVFGSRVSDYAISSYSPNVTILLNKLEESSKHDTSTNRLLLVSQPDTPGLAPIPATTEETQIVQNIMQGVNIPCVLLEREDATLAQVTSAMKSHNWVHFACHAVQNPEDPLKSGFHLHDGRLELLDMIREAIPTRNPNHAFLSACQTGAGDEKLVEEVVHVAASMLAAGYKSVVATMWSISDRHGPVVAKLFYQYIVADAARSCDDPARISSTQSAHALDRAVQELRAEVGDGEAGLLTWVPYVHLGI